MTRPTVVAAIQAPTRLNRWAKSLHWNLIYAELGDASFQERELLAIPRWEGEPAAAVLVCSALQVRTAKKVMPRVPRVWVHALGRHDRVPFDDVVDIALTHSHSVASQYASPTMRVAVIRPAYEPKLIWSWVPNKVWTMCSRPYARPDEMMKRIHRAADTLPKGSFSLYGEGTPGGFLFPPRREKLLASCSAYMSSHAKWNGFGNADHEAFAAGCPVVGWRWGDVAAEMPDEYSALTDDTEARIEALHRLLMDKHYAMDCSQMGLDLIATYRTQARMDRDVEAFLARLRDGG